MVGDEASLLLTSRPKIRENVEARGRNFFSPLDCAVKTFGGAGEISIMTGEVTPTGASWGSSKIFRSGEPGGEFKDMVEANEISNSEDKKSSNSFSGRISR